MYSAKLEDGEEPAGLCLVDSLVPAVKQKRSAQLLACQVAQQSLFCNEVPIVIEMSDTPEKLEGDNNNDFDNEKTTLRPDFPLGKCLLLLYLLAEIIALLTCVQRMCCLATCRHVPGSYIS